MDSPSLTRAELERKEREHLLTIARALDLKIPSRSRKATIIDRILEAVGADAGGGEAPPTSGGSGGNGSAGAAPEAPSTTDAGGDGPSREPAGGEPSAGGDTAATDSSPRGGATAKDPSGTSGVPDRSPDDADRATRAGASAGAGSATGSAGDGARDTSPSEGTSPSTEGKDTSPSTEAKDTSPSGGTSPSKESGGTSREGSGENRSQGSRNGGGDGQRSDGEGGGGRRRRRRRNRGGGESNADQSTGDTEGESDELVDVEGILDLRDDGYGFLRVKGLLPSREDAYVSAKLVRQYGLRKGDIIRGARKPLGRNDKNNPALVRIDAVNGDDPERARNRRKFEELTPLFPDEKLRLELPDDPLNMTARIIDLIAPIGKGQRGLIVSPPKAGKTTIMKQIAQSIERNNPEVKLIILLVDERPEEVTDMRRSVRSAEVIASTFDRPADEHCVVAELTIERAKRLVEMGEDVVIILDGITRLARAYNLAAPATGRIMSGGVDSGALYPPKKFFGAARNLEEGGSLTILATALIETGSRMDEVIFEEFKGTGNMELRLDRRLAERRIYPAIDVDASSTRHEELLFPRNQLNQVWKLRRVLSGLSGGEGGNAAAALELLIDRMRTFKSNDEFLAEIARAPGVA